MTGQTSWPSRVPRSCSSLEQLRLVVERRPDVLVLRRRDVERVDRPAHGLGEHREVLRRGLGLAGADGVLA